MVRRLQYKKRLPISFDIFKKLQAINLLKRISIKNLLTTLLLFLATIGVAQDHYPVLDRIVTDNAQILTEAQVQLLSFNLEALETETSNQLIILTIEDLNNEPIEDYAYKTFEVNKIGQKNKDNGILLLIAKEDKKVRIEVGYGLEEYLTDALASRIIREQIVPEFRKENYYTGINNTIETIITVLKNQDKAQGQGLENEQESNLSPIFKILISLVLLIIVVIASIIFKFIYQFIIEAFRGLFIGKLNPKDFLIEILQILVPLICNLAFICIPLITIAVITIDFDYERLEYFLNYLYWLYVFLGFLFIPAIVFSMLKINRLNESYRLNIYASDEAFKSNIFGNSARGSSNSSSSSYSSSGNFKSSSSSFSGGGGRSGGGGASGSW
ncbi:TPM domain-containing protein [Cellulophaga algicola]|uniref:TPM domain-containing protein n=1 Tax=Cellulophaga algicola TaxID=59600 RepID=UPI001FDF996C|nr:TPM domain-containing protein [Cellulophaga algicola]